MSNKPLKAIGICGSLRKNSWNLKLLTLALKTLESNSVQTEFFDLSNIPIFAIIWPYLSNIDKVGECI